LTPEAIALTCGDQHLSYGELNACANRVAHRLQKLGVKPETLVGICLDRSLDMVVGILGILKAGGAYVPIEPKNPAERIEFILEDAQTPVLVTEKSLAPRFREMAACQIVLDLEEELLSTEPRHNPTCPASESNIAYVIY